MPIIDKKENIRQKIKFFCSAAVEMASSLHVLSNPEHHNNSTEWAEKTIKRLSSSLREDILYFAENYNQWSFIMDIVSESVYSEDDSFDTVIKRIEEMDEVEFSYLFLAAWNQKKEIEEWLNNPDTYNDDEEIKKYISYENVVYFLKNTKLIIAKVIDTLKRYWDEFFCKEWERIHLFCEKKIHEQEEALFNSDPIEYILSLHNNISFDNNIFTINKETKMYINLDGTDEIVIFPSVFVAPHLMMNILGNRFTIYLNLKFNFSMIKEVPDYLVASLKSLSDDTRLKILSILTYEEKTTKELSEILGFTAGTISQHLKVLKDADVIKFRKLKKFVYYSINMDRVYKVLEDTKSFLKS